MARSANPGIGRPQRQHYWDVVRGFLMLMGIPYHAALIYDGRIIWFVSAPESSRPIELFADVVHMFRMPAFFLVAGYFAAMMLERRQAMPWARARLLRLGIPFLCCVLFINPLQTLLSEFGQQGVGPYDVRAACAATGDALLIPGRLWIRHAWFLTVLIYFNSAAALLVRASPRLAKFRYDRRISGRSFVIAAVLLGVIVGFYEIGAGLSASRAGFARGPARDIFSLPSALIFLPYFAIGCALQRCDGLLERFTTLSTVLAGCLFGALVMSRIDGQFEAVPKAVVALLSAQVLLALARRFLDRPSPAVTHLVQASFVIYLFHMPVVQLLGIVALHVHLPAIGEWALIVVTALPICLGIHRLIVGNRWLNFAFSGVVPGKRTQATA